MAAELAVLNGAQGPQFTPDQVELLKRTICKDATDDELKLFINQCTRTKLDPFAKQIHAVKRWDAKAGRDVMAIQTGIDGYRLIAERTGSYEGQTPVQWCGEDGVWKDIWLAKENPAGAKVGVYKKGFREAVFAVALWSEYVQQYRKDGKTFLSPMWQKMGALMLGKCAESLALRKAFPQELSGIYTQEEMDQAENPDPTPQLPVKVIVKAPEATEEVRKKWRQWRAKLNQTLLGCKSSKEIEEKEAKFLELTKQGPDIWFQYTYHNETETFYSLAEEHRGRVRKIEEMQTVAWQEEWRQKLEHCEPSEFKSFETVVKNNEWMQSPHNLDALAERGRQLGIEEYAVD